LRTEKVDVVQWREDPAQLIAEALGPAKVREVRIDEEARAAIVVVSDHQLSLAIGREGQNARLAARLTGYRVDIRSESEEAGGTVASRAESAPPVAEVSTATPVEEPIAATEQVVEPAVATAETVVEISEDVVEPAPETAETVVEPDSVEDEPVVEAVVGADVEVADSASKEAAAEG
jgi:hypothetical protein